MVSTRGAARKRKDPEPGFRYFDDEALEEAERIDREKTFHETALADDARKRLTKKKREALPAFTGDRIGLLPAELLQRIASFVQEPESLYNLSLCNKSCRSAITTELIIRAAIFGDKKSRGTLSAIMGYVEARSIYTPSKWRLLRLVVGKRYTRHKTG